MDISKSFPISKSNHKCEIRLKELVEIFNTAVNSNSYNRNYEVIKDLLISINYFMKNSNFNLCTHISEMKNELAYGSFSVRGDTEQRGLNFYGSRKENPVQNSKIFQKDPSFIGRKIQNSNLSSEYNFKNANNLEKSGKFINADTNFRKNLESIGKPQSEPQDFRNIKERFKQNELKIDSNPNYSTKNYDMPFKQAPEFKNTEKVQANKFNPVNITKAPESFGTNTSEFSPPLYKDKQKDEKPYQNSVPSNFSKNIPDKNTEISGVNTPSNFNSMNSNSFLPKTVPNPHENQNFNQNPFRNQGMPSKTIDRPTNTLENQYSNPSSSQKIATKCINCSKIDGITKECPHTLCKDCLFLKYGKISQRSFLGRMFCELCNSEIKVDIYLSPVDLINYRKDAIEKKRMEFIQDAVGPLFTCLICMQDEILVSDSITLDCVHRFCPFCIKNYLTEAITSGSLKDLKCPECNEEIDYNLIKANVDPKTFDLYLKLTTRIYKPQDNRYFSKECFNCPTLTEIPKDLEWFTCPGCGFSYCPQCNYNHRGIKCSEYLAMTLPNLSEISYLECPACSEAITLEKNGCNFLKCPYANCEKTFCGLCQTLLPESEHYFHYKKQGPFGSTCNTLDEFSNS